MPLSCIIDNVADITVKKKVTNIFVWCFLSLISWLLLAQICTRSLAVTVNGKAASAKTPEAATAAAAVGNKSHYSRLHHKREVAQRK